MLDKFYKDKKVLVTGHTGFKGAWLTIWLKELGADIVGYSLDPAYENGIYNLSNISDSIIDYREDLRDFPKLLEVFNKEKPEIVFHLGAQALVIDGYSSPLETFQTNTMGTANVLEAIRLTDSVKTAVMVTTDKVYENKEWIWPYREEETIGGYDPYSASKGACELIISSYRNSFFNTNKYDDHGKAIASVRAGNVIGGGDWCDNRIIPDCIKSIEKDEEIEVRSPNSVRPWQHVLEPIGGYLHLGAKMIEDPISYSQAWNFGPEHENIITVSELVSKLIKSYGKGNWKDISNSNQLHEATLLSLDINKAKTNLNWNPVLGIDATIEYTTEWYKSYTSTNVLDLTKSQIKNYVDLWKSQKDQ
ncbi:CDP-glucose 4,6-dehydratase [Flavobacteriaceae bacterium]|nr:CDP-glucose 4,6-dehydratase [Flavobacteriaceae bacterium]